MAVERVERFDEVEADFEKVFRINNKYNTANIVRDAYWELKRIFPLTIRGTAPTHKISKMREANDRLTTSPRAPDLA